MCTCISSCNIAYMYIHVVEKVVSSFQRELVIYWMLCNKEHIIGL